MGLRGRKPVMRSVVIFATRTGTTEKCAKRLAKKMQADLVNLTAHQKCDLSLYDTVVLGCNVRNEKFNPAMLRFMKKHEQELLTKRLGLFICNGFAAGTNRYFMKNVSPYLLNASILYDTLGGEYRLEHAKGFVDRWVLSRCIQAVKDGTGVGPVLSKKKVDDFAAIMMAEKAQG